MLRSITPKRARRPSDASVDHTEARCVKERVRIGSRRGGPKTSRRETLPRPESDRADDTPVRLVGYLPETIAPRRL